MTKKLTVPDLKALRRVIRHVATSDTTVQNEALRLDALLAAVIRAHETSHNTQPRKEAS